MSIECNIQQDLMVVSNSIRIFKAINNNLDAKGLHPIKRHFVDDELDKLAEIAPKQVKVFREFHGL